MQTTKLIGALLAAATLTAASGVRAQATLPGAERNFYFGLFAGLTGGGDNLATVRLSDGSTQSIHGGGLVHVGVGAAWQPSGVPVAMQATVGYHVDNVTASNGDVKFSRVPFEILGFYTGLPNWRFGGGMRLVNSIELAADVNGFNDSVKYKDATGGVFEIGYQIAPRVWVNGRYTAEKYEAASINGTSVTPTGQTSGNSAGINLVVLF